MIYFVVAVFPLFGASKDLIIDSQRTMIFDKDRENQSKYYLCYPRLPVLDMKWENCSVNVAQRENISKFSMLDDIVNSVRLLKLFFLDGLVEMIAGYTKLCSRREEADTNFQIANANIRLFLSMLLSGCHKLPEYKMYRRPLILLCKHSLI